MGMINNYNNHKLQANPRHREEEPRNTDCHKPLGRQLKQSNQLSRPHQDDWKKN